MNEPRPDRPRGGQAAPPVPDLSVVIPVRDEAENIRPLYDEIVSALGGRAFELIYVDDGSADETFRRIEALYRGDPRVRAVKLRTNCGKAAAYAAGFQVARGRVIATMDGDLQDDPRDLLPLLAALDRDFDLVVGWKQGGKSSRRTHLLSIFFNAVIRLMTGVAVHDMNCPMRVMRRGVCAKLHLYGNLHRYIPLLAARQGFRLAEVPIANRERLHGKTKYSSGKYVKSFFDFMTVYFHIHFAERPLHLFGLVGVASLLVGLAFDLWLTLRFFIGGISPQEDLPTLLFGVLLILLGIQMLSIGLLGEMILRGIVMSRGDLFYDVESVLTHE